MANESKLAELLRRGPKRTMSRAELAESMRDVGAPADVIEAAERGLLDRDPPAPWRMVADLIDPEGADDG